MPKPTQKHGAQLSKREKQSEILRSKRVANALDDEGTFFGRVTKINMNRAVVILWDHELERHTEIQATLPNKKKGFIQINDIVNLAKSNPNWEIQVSIDKKTATELRKEGRLTDVLMLDIDSKNGTAVDSGFEFDYDGNEVTEVPKVDEQPEEVKNRRTMVTIDDDDDINIDKI